MKRVALILVTLFLTVASFAQPFRGTVGLLHAPSAEMNDEGTFMFGGNVLDLVPMHWYDFNHEISHTYDYYLNVTLFPWFEVGYTGTLNYAVHGSGYFPEQSWGKYTNQDRSFNARIRLWKEGWWKWWTPQIVLGLDDPLSHSHYGGGDITFTDDTMNDNHFTRYYLAATKHFSFDGIGNLGVHAAVVYNLGHGSKSNSGGWKSVDRWVRPTIGANFRLSLPEANGWLTALNGLEALAEYDARTFNMGLRYTCLKERMHFLVELNDFKYWSGGVYFTIPLLSSEKRI